MVDLCCGTGAIAAAVSAAIPDVEVWAADVDPAALACARRNVRADRVVEGDLYEALPDALRGRVDVLVANAPYVPTAQIPAMPAEARLHEPRTALDGGTDGGLLHRRVAAAAADWLAPGGSLLLETSRPLARVTLGACEDAGLTTRLLEDDDLDAAVAVAVRPAAP